MSKHLTTDDLKTTLADLTRARAHLVYFLAKQEDPQRDAAFKQLAKLQAVVAAYEAVIASGASDPMIEHDQWLDNWLASKQK